TSGSSSGSRGRREVAMSDPTQGGAPNGGAAGSAETGATPSGIVQADASVPAGGSPAGSAPAGGGGPTAAVDPRVAEVLEQLRSGVRLRQAEAAVAAGLGDLGAPGPGAGFAQGLLAVRSAEYVQEPIAFSHRARLGRLIVGSRKAFFQL